MYENRRIGTNTFIWLKKCKGSQIYVDLSYYGGIIGECLIKVRSHYHVLMIINVLLVFVMGIKYKSKTKGQNCEIGLGQCKKGLLYRREIIEKNGIITIGNFVYQESIDDNSDCDLAHVSGHLSYDHAIFSSSHFNPHVN